MIENDYKLNSVINTSTINHEKIHIFLLVSM